MGSAKVGNLAHHVGTEVADPLKAKVFVAEDGGDRLALAALDTLSVGRKHVAEMRRRVEEELGFPGENVMIVATHTHGSPAVVRCGEVAADEAYVASVTDAVLGGFREAWGGWRRPKWVSGGPWISVSPRTGAW